MSKLELAVTPSIKLRESQANLYSFIVEKYNSGKTINLQEIIELYVSNGNRMVYDGVPYFYEYNYKDQRDYKKQLKGDMLKGYAIQWFIRNLGIFVVKGLLAAIPTMQLADIEVEANL